MQLIIRYATIGDCKAFLLLASERDKAAKKPTRRLYWSKKFKALVKEKQLFIALHDDRLVGFLYFRSDFLDHPAAYYVELVFVSRHFRKHGVARDLFSKIESVARMHGCSRIFSSADFDNIVSLAMHRQLGYKRCGHIAGIEGPKSNEIFLVKILNEN